MGDDQSKQTTAECHCGCEGDKDGHSAKLGDLDLHVLSAGGDTVQILKRGGAVVSWRFRDGRQLLDGYQNQQEADELEGYRNAVLAPWSNRIRDAVFNFDGKAWDQGVDPTGIREALHGRIAKLEFQVLGYGEDAEECPLQVGPTDTNTRVAWVQLGADLAAAPSYPWPLRIEVVYALVAGETSQLKLRLSATNSGGKEAPVTLGWHPYLRHQGDPKKAHIHVDAHCAVQTGDDNIPLAGEAAFRECSGLDVVGPADMDDAFTQLVADSQGLAGATLRHEDGSTTALRAHLQCDQRGVGIVHVFTGECLPHRGGEALAVEPCLMMTDAFNRSECAQAVPLRGGQTRTLEATLEFTPPQD